jgi:hypothetical protein
VKFREKTREKATKFNKIFPKNLAVKAGFFFIGGE